MKLSPKKILRFSSVVIVALLSASPVYAQNAKNLEVLSAKWLSIESQKGEIKKTWAEREHKIQTQIALLEAEKLALQEYIQKLDQQEDEVSIEREKISSAQIKFESQQAKLASTADMLTEKLVQIAPLLPPPLFDDWREDLSFLGDNKKTNSERLERIARLVLKLYKFNDRIAVHKTTMELQAGASGVSPVQVKQIYLGSSQGWYASEDGKYFGYGRPQDGKWQWWHNDDARQVLGTALDPNLLLIVIKNIEHPAYAELVSVPVSIQ